MDEKELKQGVGLNSLRERDKINGLVGAKNGGGEGQPYEKRENKWISSG